MYKDIARELAKEMSEIIKVDEEGLFVMSIYINSMEYFYDEKLDKIRFSVDLKKLTNSELFQNSELSIAFEEFSEVVASAIHDYFLSSKELEKRVNKAIAERLSEEIKQN